MVKNEEKYLERCLRGLIPILDALEAELIIVDTGSTDNTLEIARRYTQRVYEHVWTNDFSEMRNTVLSYASGEWFLFVDGDEILEDASGLISFFKSGKHQKFNSAFIQMKNILSLDHEDFATSHVTRFFRKSEGFRFVGAIHEQPIFRGPMAQIKGELIHYGYLRDDEALMEYKFERNVKLLKEELEKDPKNLYYWFQLSQSFSMHGKHKEAVEPALKAYKLAKQRNFPDFRYTGEQLAIAYSRDGQPYETEQLCHELLRLKDNNSIDAYYLLAGAQLGLGKLEDSASNYLKYLSLLEDFHAGRYKLGPSQNLLSINKKEHVQNALSNIYSRLGKYELAVHHGDLVKSPEIAQTTVGNLVGIFLKQENATGIKSLFDRWAGEEKVLTATEIAIESQWMTIEESFKLELIEALASMESDYGRIHAVRANYYRNEPIEDKVWDCIQHFSYSDHPDYYGEYFFAQIRCGRPIFDQAVSLRSNMLTGYSFYLSKLYTDAAGIFLEHLSDSPSWRAHPAADGERIRASLSYGLLLNSETSDLLYQRIFDCYVNSGIAFLEASYNVSVLDNASVSWMRNPSDRFLLYMRLAQNTGIVNALYVRYLRLALAQDGSMKKAIDLLIKDVQNQLENPEEEELKKLKRSVQEEIKNAINEGELETAVALINQYEDAVGVDAPLCSAKGIIYMIDGQLEEAEEVFLAGLELEPGNVDLLYNLEYLRRYLAEPEGDARAVDGASPVKMLIGSPIRQKPAILREFLKSLEEIDTTGLDVAYLFIDDNVDSGSTELLRDFSQRIPNVAIHVVENDEEEYVTDEVTHRWKEQLVWKVAAFKDMIIEIAKEFNFDYLFLADSDLVFHPLTIRHLVSRQKEIVSNIFWTQWNPDAPILPQVWLSDSYTQYAAARGENLSQDEIFLRHQRFLHRLRQPGIYEVGGLGACTLISSEAIHKGVRFEEIKNLSFWGEDRHFCIRATSLGFPLYVDTHYPAYHIYRDTDLAGVEEYKDTHKRSTPRASIPSVEPEKLNLGILFIYDAMRLGGAETHIITLAKELARRDHRVFIVAPNGPANAWVAGIKGVVHIPCNITDLYTSVKQVVSVINEYNIDIIHAHPYVSQIVGASCADLTGLPLVTTLHSTVETPSHKYPYNRFYDRYICVSDEIKDFNSDKFTGAQTPIVISNCVEITGFPRYESFFRKEQLRLLFVGRLDPDKLRSLDFLLNALPAIQRKHDVELTVVGDGTHLNEIIGRAFAINSKFDKRVVNVVGGSVAVHDYISEADIVFGVGRVVLEAIAAGKFAICLGNEFYPGLVDSSVLLRIAEVNFTDRNSSIRLSKQRLVRDICRVLGNFDTEFKCLSKTYDIVKERFSVENGASKHLELYHDLIRAQL